MFRRTMIRNILAWVLLATVFLVCISPFADLEDCALRSQRSASLFFWLLASAIFMLVMFMRCELRSSPVYLAAIQRNTTWLRPDTDLLTELQTLRV